MNGFPPDWVREQILAPAVEHIHDASRFKDEGDAALRQDESKAIGIAKRHLQRQFGKQLRGTFTVAAADWGYQVDFEDLQSVADAGDQWEQVSEGFGEVFLSKDFLVIRADVGP